MTHEIGQFDGLKLQPLPSGGQSKRSAWTDIGEARVTHTIFGGAKVRITRKRDKVRRALLLAVVSASAALAAIQQGWISIQQAELQQTATKLGWSFAEPIKSLAIPPVSASLLDVAPAAKSKMTMPPQPETRNTSAQKSTPPQQPIKAPETVAVKPATHQHLSAPRPQMAVSTATISPAATTATPSVHKPLAASSPAANTSSIAKLPPSSMAATSGSEAVAQQVLEPLLPQSATDDQQQRVAANEPGRSN